MTRRSAWVLICWLLFLSPSAAQDRQVLRAGIIGLDTSHVVEFTKLLNNSKSAADLAGVRVVAAFPGGSADIASSRDRLEGFTKQLRDQFQVEIDPDEIPQLRTVADLAAGLANQLRQAA